MKSLAQSWLLGELPFNFFGLGRDLALLIVRLENLNSSLFDDLVHQIDKVALEVGLRVLLGEDLNHVIDEVFELLGALLGLIAAEVKRFQELLHVVLALLISVRVVDQTKGLNQV